MESRGETTSSSLKGIKVLELATVLAGPAVGMFLAELGAEVTKIENPLSNGDVTRGWKLKSEDPKATYSAYFSSVNWGKKHVFANLKQEKDLKMVQELASKADIVISNHTQAQSGKFNLDYGSIVKSNPQVIYGHITGFGENDGRPAYDVVLQAETGYMFMNGQPGSEPTKMPIALIDILAAHQLKQGLLLALLNKEKTGKGALVSASLLDSAISALSNQATNWLMEGFIPSRIGSVHPNIAPYGELITTSDHKKIVLAVGSETHFQNLCDVLYLSDLKTDDRFDTNQKRVANRDILHRLISTAGKKLNSKELMNQLLDKRVPVGLIKNMKEVFQNQQTMEMTLSDKMLDGKTATRPKQVAFKLI